MFSQSGLICALLQSVVLAPKATDTDQAAIDRIVKGVEAARKLNGVPGVSLAVIKDDRIVLLKGFGYRDVAKKLPVTSETTFCIGSATKAFTGLLVAQSAVEGKLSLDDSPHKLLPELRLKDSDANERITITDMLCHRSGLPRVDLAWYSGAFSRDEMFDIIANVEPTAKLRQKWQYSNFMFMAAGVLAGRANGTTYEDLLQKRVFEPLGMSTSTVSYSGAMGSKELSVGYTPGTQKPLPYRNIDTAAPAGAINSNAREMAQWVRLQLGEGTLDGKRIFAADAIAATRKQRIEMIPGTGVGYGFGWMLRKWNDLQLIEHGGNVDGFNAEVAFIPEKKVGFVMLTNVSASPLTQQAFDIVFKELVALPKPTAAEKPSKSQPKFKEVVDSDMGDYEIPALKIRLSFKKDKSKVSLIQSKVEVPLKLVGDKAYRTDMKGAPDVKLTWQASKKDPKQPEILLEQNGMKFTLVKDAPYQPPMTGEALLAKMVEARGGKEAVLKSGHSTSKFLATLPSDGITIQGYGYEDGGKKAAQFGVFFGLGRRFGVMHNFTDGRVVREDVSFAPSDWVYGAARVQEIEAANVYTDLDPKANYLSLKVIREEKVRDEDAYVLNKIAKSGWVTTEFVSKKTFRVLRWQAGQTSTELEDYRTIDGVTLPFKQTVQAAEGGPRVIQVQSVDFQSPIPGWVFRYAPPKKR